MIDRSNTGRYKVTYYMSGQTVVSKWFKTLTEAMQFSVYQVKTGDVIEIKRYEDES